MSRVSSPVVAALTPFQRSGAVDPAARRDQLHLLTAAGVRTLLVNGTTGEFAACTAAEQRTVLELCRAAWPGTLIAHIGGGPVGDVLALAEHAHDHAALLAVITPFFHAEPPRAGVEEYLRRVLAGLRLPALLYSLPRYTQVPLAPESRCGRSGRRTSGRHRRRGRGGRSGRGRTAATGVRPLRRRPPRAAAHRYRPPPKRLWPNGSPVSRSPSGRR